jgi:elongation factor Tu
VYVLTREEDGQGAPILKRYPAQFYFHAKNIEGMLWLPEGIEMLLPGYRCEVEVELDWPVAIEPGLELLIRREGQTIGVGICT